MKKNYFWSILTLIIATFLPTGLLAQKSTSANSAGNTAQRETGRHVTADEARAVGLRFLNANTGHTRGADDLQMATAYCTIQGDTAFYVFNTTNGFVMVSADRCATPILGYSDEGPFNTENIPIQMQGYLQDFVEQIEYGMENQVTDERAASQWATVSNSGRLSNTRSNEAVEPLITAMWDQGCYYNAKCPEDPNGYCGGHVPTGCVATAMGMIMHYWGYPLHGVGSKRHIWNCTNSLGEYYPEQYVNFGETTYDWANMPDHLDENSTQAQIDAVSTLLLHCGVAAEMAYKPSSASTTNSMATQAFNNYFGYSDAHLVWLSLANGQWGIDHGMGSVFDYDGWINMLKSNLLLGQPIYYSGVSVLAEAGHAWVCDGFSDNLFHFNWGWGGANNGYFALFPTALSEIPYNEIAISAMINIHPQCDYENVYQINVQSNIDTAGSILGAGTYGCSQICNLSAIANNGFTFSNWTENGEIISSEPNISFSVYKSCNLVANFVCGNDNTFSVVASTEHGGNVVGDGIFSPGQQCTLSAVADSGYSFQYWTEAGIILSFDSNYTFTVLSDRNIVAHFSELDSSKCDLVFRLSHTDGWINTDIVITYDNDSVESFNVQSQLGTCSFERSVHSGSQIEVCWTFTGDGAIYDNLGFEIRYANGTPIYGCVQCVEDCVSFYVDCSGTISPRNVSAISIPQEGGIVIGDGTYGVGETCVLMAIPDSGYTFVNWMENGTIVSTEAMYVFNVYSDRNFIVNFSAPFIINASVNLSDYGSIVDGTGSFIYGQTCNLKAVANEGYCFYYWSENGEIVSMDTNYSFVVTSSRNLVATFGLPLTVTATFNPTEGSVSGEGTYSYNHLCILNATPADGYCFKRWMENGKLVSHNANYSFNVRTSRNLVAVFEEEVDTIPGLLNGLFSVSSDRQVRFSKGNLQYIGSANEPYWKFAENQYDYLGDNGQCSSDENVDRDLFGWGTSGYNHGAVCFQPWSTSLSNSDYSAYGSDLLNLYDNTRQADWGYNPISNGGNETNQWRTLTSSEWNYLINTRNTQSGLRCVLANVNGVNGVILLPDNWDLTIYPLTDSRFYDSNIITYSAWDTLESAGAVFLPASGRREGTTGLFFNGGGEYNAADRAPWPNNSAYREILFFNSYGISVPWSDSFTGIAVRLVRYQPEQPIYYVTQNGTGGGGSWDDAMGDLQNAIDFAASGQGVVWVAQGTYFGDGISENAFTISDGVRIYGGFAGNESENYDLSLRNFSTHPTILDGQHIQRTVYHQDAWSYSPVPKTSPVLDGFTIQNGHSSLGGNVFGGEPSLQVSNCTVQNGESEGDAGGLAKAVIRNSLIVNNSSTGWSSALQECDANNCIVTGNNASEIGCINLWSTLTNCIIWNNDGRLESGCNISYSAVEEPAIYGDGNILLARSNDGSSPDSNYVRFVDPENGDFRLSYGSACINSGTPDISELGLPSVDIQGLPRVLDGRIDMGPYEYYPVSVVEIHDSICEGSSVVFFDSVCTAEGRYVHHTHAEDVTLDTLCVLHLTVNQPSTGDTSAVACENFEWNGITYTHSGDYTQTFTAANGCDSVVTLNLTINQPTTGTDVQTACGSFTWIDGITYTENNSTATYTLTNAASCDSVVTLDLTVNQPTTGTEVQTACGNFTWIDGITYTESNNTATFTLTNAAGCDSVVTLNLTLNQPTTGTDVQTACGSFTWIDGITYTESNSTATYTLTNTAGCDSVVTLNLTVNQPTSGTDVQTACESFTWIDGVTYTESNSTATYTLTNAAGCDSVVTLNLTLNQPTIGTDVQTACGSFTWIDGVTYTESNNTATYTLTNAAGCDSVVTLNLTVNQPTTGTDVQTVCGSFTWIDGITYTESNNTATYTLINAVGCDSVVTLNLTLNQPTTSTDVQTACSSFTWIDGITYTESNNTATFTLTNAAGCDSVVTLDLTINQPTTGTDVQTACGSFTWIDGITYTESNNTATFTLTNAAGCDSVVTLNLTVNQPTTGTDVQTACGSFTWIDGITYTESNSTATYTLTNAAGCDSVVTLNLAIFSDETSDLSVTTPDSCYTWNSETYCTSGDYTQTFQTVHGCDSVVTLHLTITVGIDDHNLAASMTVYPNPTTGIVNVQCTMNNVQVGTMDILVYDAFGRLLRTTDGVGANNYSPLQTGTHGSSTQTQIDLSRYAPGVYLIKAVADGNVVAVRKIVKH